MQNPTADDADLVERARHGDVDAYEQLVRRYQDQALAAAYVVLHDRHEAEDAAQEGFTKAFLGLSRFRAGSSFRAWLLRIVVNEARDLRSSAQRQAEIMSRASGHAESVAGGQSAEAAALARQRREALLGALFELNETDRLVITCRYFLDFSDAEVAAVLGIARGTVKSRLSRAIARLGPILRDIGPLVLVGPGLETVVAHTFQEIGRGALVQPGSNVSHAVVQRLASGPATTPAGRSQLTLQQAASVAGVAVAAALTAAFVVFGSMRTQHTEAVPGTPPTPSVIFYGADLTDADRQELKSAFGVGDAPPTANTVWRQELFDTLTAHGFAAAPDDEAISSAQLVCTTGGSGIEVQTRNIAGLPAPAYAAALLTTGLEDGRVIVAAPASKPVSGEAALVGVFKGLPTCMGGRQPEEQRVRLAFAELKAIAGLAGTPSDMTHASAVFLQVLNSVIVGQAADDSAIDSALNSAAAQQGISVDDASRMEVVNLFDQLRGVDYATYARGYRIDELGPDHVRLVSAAGE